MSYGNESSGAPMGLIIGGVILLLIGIGVAVYFLFFHNKGDKKESSGNNSSAANDDESSSSSESGAASSSGGSGALSVGAAAAPAATSAAMPAPSSAPATGNYFTVEGKNYQKYFKPLQQKVNVTDPAACQKVCNDYPGCIGFTYNNVEGKCLFYQAPDADINPKRPVSQVSLITSKDASKWVDYKGFKFLESSINDSEVKTYAGSYDTNLTLEQCKALCAERAQGKDGSAYCGGIFYEQSFTGGASGNGIRNYCRMIGATDASTLDARASTYIKM